MKRSWHPSLWAVISASLWAASGHAQPGPQPAELELIQLNDAMYVIHNAVAPGNATALITDEGILLVDDKYGVDYDNIVAVLRTVSEQPVKYIVNTHHHGDHTGSNASFQESGALVVASEMARTHMVAADLPGQPTFTMEESARIHLGGRVVDLHFLGRAHTDGDIVVYFPDFQVLVAGDLFTYGDHLPQLIDYSTGGSAKAFSQTLDNILELGFETVVPGHGLPTTKAEMRRFRDGTVALRERARELIGEGASRDELEAVMREEFNWSDLHVARGLDGLLIELR